VPTLVSLGFHFPILSDTQYQVHRKSYRTYAHQVSTPFPPSAWPRQKLQSQDSSKEKRLTSLHHNYMTVFSWKVNAEVRIKLPRLFPRCCLMLADLLTRTRDLHYRTRPPPWPNGTYELHQIMPTTAPRLADCMLWPRCILSRQVVAHVCAACLPDPPLRAVSSDRRG
jgi:hypothetical protein